MDKNKYLIALSESPQTDFGRIDFDDQGEEQRVFSAVWALEGQVNNGGFAQYFSSHDGDTANFASAALRKIGASKCASIIERALQCVSQEPLPNDKLLREQLIKSLGDERSKELASLDSEFYQYPDNLTELLFAYVAANPEIFGRFEEI